MDTSHRGGECQDTVPPSRALPDISDSIKILEFTQDIQGWSRSLMGELNLESEF